MKVAALEMMNDSSGNIFDGDDRKREFRIERHAYCAVAPNGVKQTEHVFHEISRAQMHDIRSGQPIEPLLLIVEPTNDAVIHVAVGA